MTLDELHVGEQGRIIAVGGTGALRRRLMDMGLTPGTVVLIRKTAPLGDPIELFLRGYELTLRKNDAVQIEIEPLPPGNIQGIAGPHMGSVKKRRRRFRGGRS